MNLNKHDIKLFSDFAKQFPDNFRSIISTISKKKIIIQTDVKIMNINKVLGIIEKETIVQHGQLETYNKKLISSINIDDILNKKIFDEYIFVLHKPIKWKTIFKLCNKQSIISSDFKDDRSGFYEAGMTIVESDNKYNNMLSNILIIKSIAQYFKMNNLIKKCTEKLDRYKNNNNNDKTLIDVKLSCWTYDDDGSDFDKESYKNDSTYTNYNKTDSSRIILILK